MEIRRAVLFCCFLGAALGGQAAKPPVGKPSPEFLREMLKDARTVLPTRRQPAPAGATDLRLHRVTVYTKVGEGMIFKGGVDQ
jgi:hypothetical protein